MEALFSGFTMWDWVWIAVLSFFIMRMIQHISTIRKGFSTLKKRQMITMDYKVMDLERLLAKCRELFPIDTIYFQGKVFRRGMQVRIITLQKKVIEGELIGKSKMDLLCIKTQNQLIAHELDKIEEMEQM